MYKYYCVIVYGHKVYNKFIRLSSKEKKCAFILCKTRLFAFIF